MWKSSEKGETVPSIGKFLGSHRLSGRQQNNPDKYPNHTHHVEGLGEPF